MPKDYYDILGVSRTAGDAEIRRAFRQKARELHPDVNPAPDATRRFQELNAAYQVLGDPLRRSVYDRMVVSGVPGPNPYPPPPRPAYRPPPYDQPPHRAWTYRPRTQPPPPRDFPGAALVRAVAASGLILALALVLVGQGGLAFTFGAVGFMLAGPDIIAWLRRRGILARLSPLASFRTLEWVLLGSYLYAAIRCFLSGLVEFGAVAVGLVVLIDLSRLGVFGRHSKAVVLLTLSVGAGLLAVDALHHANAATVGTNDYVVSTESTLGLGCLSSTLAAVAHAVYLRGLTIRGRLPRRSLPGLALIAVAAGAGVGFSFAGAVEYHSADLIATGVMLVITMLIAGGWTLRILANGIAPKKWETDPYS